ncbi:hypothetical protein [Kitasatospora sp. NPDC047058]|uniref:hypothetical protein n=1 Tax=Kitasatospora sp. NPDC047058 TaxID=3155620 RepID=UPI0033E723BC
MTTRTTTTALAATTVPIGIGAAGAALLKSNTAAAVVALTLVVIGIAAVVTRTIHTAVTDTTAERQRLYAAQDRTNAEYMRYIAARAIVDADAERLCRQAAELETRVAAMIAKERDELLADVEDRAAELKQEGYFIGLEHGQRTIAEAEAGAPSGHMATVIPLPAPAIGSESTVGSGHSS